MLGVAAVVVDQPILGVEDREPVRQGLGRRQEPRLGGDALGHVAADGLDLDQLALGHRTPRCRPIAPSGCCRRAAGAAARSSVTGCSGVSEADVRRVPLAILGHGQGELVEPSPEQLLAAAAVVAAVGVADEAQPAVRRDPRDELGLGVDHGAVARLARRQPVERLAPLGQGGIAAERAGKDLADRAQQCDVVVCPALLGLDRIEAQEANAISCVPQRNTEPGADAALRQPRFLLASWHCLNGGNVDAAMTLIPLRTPGRPDRQRAVRPATG